MILFGDRREAGRHLARCVALRSFSDPVVLALPRGGVPVAYEVARALDAPLDVFTVRKLGVPGQNELALGAIASNGVRFLNGDLIEMLAISDAEVEEIATRERAELERRESLYRRGRPPIALGARTAILVDDGLATGASMQAAIRALRKLGPARIVVAVPIAPRDTCEAMRREADDVICAETPEPFFGVGAWYEDFSQTTDREVCELLERAERERRSSRPERSRPERSRSESGKDGFEHVACSPPQLPNPSASSARQTPRVVAERAAPPRGRGAERS